VKVRHSDPVHVDIHVIVAFTKKRGVIYKLPAYARNQYREYSCLDEEELCVSRFELEEPLDDD